MATLNEHGRPDPVAARTPAEFMDALRRLKDWTGLTYRQLEHRATAAGDVLPTLATALSRPGPPRQELLAAFVAACGITAGEVASWLDSARRLAADPGPAVVAPPVAIAATGPAEPGAAPPGSVEPPAGRPFPRIRSAAATLVPPAIREGSWSLRVMAAVAALLVAATVTGAVVQAVRDATGTPAATGQRPQGDDTAAPEDSPGGAEPSTSAATAPSPAPPAPSPTGRVTTVVAEDTTIVSSDQNAAAGHDAGILTCCVGQAGESRALVKFQVTALPAGCQGHSTMRLWGIQASHTYVAYQVDSGWTEDTARWSDQPARLAKLGGAHGGKGSGWVTFGLSSFTATNGTYAFEIVADDEGASSFAAHENTSVGRPAELITTYTCGTPVVASGNLGPVRVSLGRPDLFPGRPGTAFLDGPPSILGVHYAKDPRADPRPRTGCRRRGHRLGGERRDAGTQAAHRQGTAGPGRQGLLGHQQRQTVH